VTSYIFDGAAVIAGLVGGGVEHHRREFSRLLSGAFAGGPPIEIPALCLVEANAGRGDIAAHLAQIAAEAPLRAIVFAAFERTERLDDVRRRFPRLTWSEIHAVVVALDRAAPLVTTVPERYKAVPVDVMDM
jgi:hypothetical protein